MKVRRKISVFNNVLKTYVHSGDFYDDEKVFIKYVKTKNKYRKNNSYNIEVDCINGLKEWGLKTIIIVEEDTGKKYEISLDEFLKKSIITDYKESRPQYSCNLKHFKVVE